MSRDFLRENLSFQKLVYEGCLHVAYVRLMLCLMMQAMLLYQQPQVANKCVLHLVVVVQQFQLLIQVVSYVYSSFHPSTFITFIIAHWFLSDHNLGTSILMARVLQHY